MMKLGLGFMEARANGDFGEKARKLCFETSLEPEGPDDSRKAP